MRSKRAAYIVATLVAMIIFLPFQDQSWALYVGVCSGYTVLVFGLRRVTQKRETGNTAMALSASKICLVHASFLAIVTGWVWLLMAIRPKLPYFLRTEDTNRPYFGLIFLGVIALLLLEYFEQRQLRADPDTKAENPSMSGGT